MDVKEKLELIRVIASFRIPPQSLAAAIIMSYIEENDGGFNEL